MWDWWQERALPSPAMTSSVSTRTRPRSGLLRRGKMPIYEPGLEELVHRNRAEGPTDVHDDAARRPSATAAVVFIAVGTPQGEDGSADLKYVLEVARDIAKRDERLQGHRRQEHRAGRDQREGPRGDPARDDAPLQRRQQSRVPEAGRRDRRLHEAGSRGHRRRGCTSAGADARALRAVHPDRCAHHDHGLCQRRAGQIRGQRHAGDADFVHERSGQRLRARRRRRGSGPPRDGLRQAHRHVVSVSRRRLRRQLFPEGRPGDDRRFAADKELRVQRSSRPSKR